MVEIIAVACSISAVSALISVVIQFYALKKSYKEFFSADENEDGCNSTHDSGDC